LVYEAIAASYCLITVNAQADWKYDACPRPMVPKYDKFDLALFLKELSGASLEEKGAKVTQSYGLAQAEVEGQPYDLSLSFSVIPVPATKIHPAGYRL
jgi:hypothetical protein